MGNTLVAKFAPEDHATVSAAAAAAAAALLASATEVEDGNDPPWHPDSEYAFEVLFDAISSRSSLLAPENDGQMFSLATHRPHRHREGGVRKGYMAAFWRRIVDGPDAFPSEFWQLMLQSNLTAFGEKCRLVSVGMTWRRLIIARTMRQWRPRLEEVNREVRQFGVAVPGGEERMGWRARMLHKTCNRFVPTDCSNTFNTVNRTAVLG